MPSAQNYENKVDKDKYGIYATENSAINQRLEGWIHLSKNFRTSFTKDQVMWGGKEEILIEKLYKYLKSAKIYESDDTKEYNFIDQAKRGSWLWSPEEDPISTDGDDFPGKIKEPIAIPPIEDPERDPDPIEDSKKFPSAEGQNITTDMTELYGMFQLTSLHTRLINL